MNPDDTNPPATMPTLTTGRLLLRPFQPTDAPAVQLYASDRAIAATTRGIPHPYPDGAAEKWIAMHEEQFRSGREVVFAICPGPEWNSPEWNEEPDPSGDAPDLLGSIGLIIDSDDHRAELGYWVARPYWNRGIASQSARAVIRYGFVELGLNRIVAHHMSKNPSSGRVLERAGMQREGLLPQHARKWGEFHDIVLYGILASDFDNQIPPG